MGTKQGFPVNA